MGWNISIGWMGNPANLPKHMRSTAQIILFMKIIIEEYMDVYGKIKVMQKVTCEQNVNACENMQQVSFLPLFAHQQTGKHLSTMCVSTGEALVVD